MILADFNSHYVGFSELDSEEVYDVWVQKSPKMVNALILVSIFMSYSTCGY
jgi:hypothetical protein